MEQHEHKGFGKIWFGVLHFFKLLNHKDELSLTNIAFWIFLYKIAVADISTMSANELATALSVVGLYFGTKVLNRNVENNTTASTVSKVAGAVSDVASAIKTVKTSEEKENEDGDC